MVNFPLPACFDEEETNESENDIKERLFNEQLVYEIELIDIIERTELYFE